MKFRLYRQVPKSIWALGFVSMLMDVSSEMIHGLLPVFLVTVIGASATTIGLIEGIGEGIALITRLFSGAFSDWLGRRKILLQAGYLLGTLTKPLFAMATGIGLVFTARALDRFGKGLRGAPRDALVAELTPAANLGAAYGLRQSLDSLGAFVGPLLAIVFMLASSNNFRLVFWIAVIPGIAAVMLLTFFVHEPRPIAVNSVRLPLKAGEVARLGGSFWMVLAIAFVFTLARFSEAFLLIRAEALGMSPGMVPSVLMLLSLVYAIGAYPAGYVSDRVDRSFMLGTGLFFLVVADLILAAATDVYHVMAGAAFWGLHLAFTQGLFAALVASASPPEVRGTAFGIYGFATGVAVLTASVVAGLLTEYYGGASAFIAGAFFSILALVGFIGLRYSGRILFKSSR